MPRCRAIREHGKGAPHDRHRGPKEVAVEVGVEVAVEVGVAIAVEVAVAVGRQLTHAAPV